MKFFHFLLNLFFPPHCTFCEKEGDFLCKECIENASVSPILKRSHMPYKLDFNHINGVIYGLNYDKNLAFQAAISQFKYKFTQELSEKFAELMVHRLSELAMTQDKTVVLIPIPLHKKRLAYRGFNQALVLCEAIAKNSPVEIHSVLRRVKNTDQQAKLGKKARGKNLSGAFEFLGSIEDLEGKVCFLVDDVCTTGSTLDESARVLKEGGLQKVYGLVVARAFKK